MKGQFSIVRKCLYKGKTERACRIYRKGNVNNEKFIAQFQLITGIVHPNIIQIYEAFETLTDIQIICERIKGEELFERIVTLGHYSEIEAAKVLRCILSAVECLHSKGVVHGDIRPESLIYQSYNANAVLKLRDVSFSKFTPNTHTSIYVAPENEAIPTMAGDIWGLGVVLYIMLCGLEPDLDHMELTEISPGFTLPWCDDLSLNAKNLIQKMLARRPCVRIAAKQALDDVWVNGRANKVIHMEGAVERLKEFNARRKFRAATKVVLVTNQMSNKPLRKKELR
ncbi:calcium/calmodulin-dependent protein kinase type IV-like isoform X2 [Rhodnius prolixus]|uniref:calcium/calmodulin-dependent protein kinase type IV-like isoform X2 n=1 Tax=Rhodnius prolixus TaxID=13249 RepID=UPI003D18A205